MRFSILHTTARPEHWRNTYQNWIAAAAHPQEVEYVLCVDARWGFPHLPEVPFHEWMFSRGTFTGQPLSDGLQMRNQVCSNDFPYKHSGYVSGVNTAAAASTGEILVVIADDFFPCPNWDERILATLLFDAKGEWVMWCPTNTPQEFERNIMVAPILSRSRYERLGYVLYLKYESMYADNDFAEHAQFDQAEGRCRIIKADFVFDHRHPFFHPEQMDDVYRAQNHPEAYAWGKQVLDARRAAHFGEVAETTLVRRRIAILAPGESFSRRWLIGWTDLVAGWGAAHDVVVSFPYSTNVYVSRAAGAKNILELEVAPEFVLWVDDDNPPFEQYAAQLLRDLEANPYVSMVAGWCLTQDGKPSFGAMVDGKRLDADLEVFQKGPELQRIDWTGFPMVLMRYSLLKEVGWKAFLPILEEGDPEECANHVGFGWLGEDIGFCKRATEKGYTLLVDRRVKLEHLKLQDILPAGEASRPAQEEYPDLL